MNEVIVFLITLLIAVVVFWVYIPFLFRRKFIWKEIGVGCSYRFRERTNNPFKEVFEGYRIEVLDIKENYIKFNLYRYKEDKNDRIDIKSIDTSKNDSMGKGPFCDMIAGLLKTHNAGKIREEEFNQDWIEIFAQKDEIE